jgi:hypothetical protein
LEAGSPEGIVDEIEASPEVRRGRVAPDDMDPLTP